MPRANARPRSEDKRLALLRAAIDIFAAQGLSAPTSQIARQAGVAEGTLFGYFATKEALFRGVFEHLVGEMEAFVAEGYETSRSLKARPQHLSERYIDWGVRHQAAYATLNLLALSGKLSTEQMEAASTFCADLGCSDGRPVFDGLDVPHSNAFADALMTSIANATIATKNSILLVEYAIVARRGHPARPDLAPVRRIP